MKISNRGYVFVFLITIIAILFLLFVIPVKYYQKKTYPDIDSMTRVKKSVDVSNSIFLPCLDNNLYKFLDCAKPLVLQRLQSEKFTKESLFALYTEFNNLLDSKKMNEMYCHDLSHEVGKFVNAHYKNQEYTLSLLPFKETQSFPCAYGYVHGVVGDTLEGVESQNKMIRELAEEFQKENLGFQKDVYVGGMHELGHFAFQNNSKIEDAEKLCTEISKNREYEISCLSGIFMENLMQMRKVDLPVPIDYCDNFSGFSRTSCLYIIDIKKTEMVEKQKEILDYCNGQKEEGDRHACARRYVVQSFGKNIKGAYENSLNFCMSQTKKEYKFSCLYYLSFDVMRYYDTISKRKLANQLCAEFAYVDFLRCRKKVMQQYGGNMFFTLPENLDHSIPEVF